MRSTMASPIGSSVASSPQRGHADDLPPPTVGPVRSRAPRSRGEGEFTDFYRAERDALVSALALSIGDLDLATDAVDEAMVRACSRWDQVGSMHNPPGWVFRTAKNWAITQIRRRRFLTRGDLPEPVWTDSNLDLDLVRALADLPDSSREVLVLRYLLGWSQADIAAAIGTPAGTVKSRLNRGLTALRTHRKVEQ